MDVDDIVTTLQQIKKNNETEKSRGAKSDKPKSRSGKNPQYRGVKNNPFDIPPPTNRKSFSYKIAKAEMDSKLEQLRDDKDFVSAMRTIKSKLQDISRDTNRDIRIEIDTAENCVPNISCPTLFESRGYVNKIQVCGKFYRNAILAAESLLGENFDSPISAWQNLVAEFGPANILRCDIRR